MIVPKCFATATRVRTCATMLSRSTCVTHLFNTQHVHNAHNDNKIVPLIYQPHSRKNIHRNILGISLEQFKMNNNYSNIETPQLHSRQFSSDTLMPLNQYNDIVEETLEELADYFEDLYDDGIITGDFDCVLADGVLTANLGQHGIYVINKQTPNRQIWLSSPISGPKRYDFIDSVWKYVHDGETLHGVLSLELSELYETDVDFKHLAFGPDSL